MEIYGKIIVSTWLVDEKQNDKLWHVKMECKKDTYNFETKSTIEGDIR